MSSVNTPLTIQVVKASHSYPSPWAKQYQCIYPAMEKMNVTIIEVRSPADLDPEIRCILMESPFDIPQYAMHFDGHTVGCHVHGQPCIPFGNWDEGDFAVEKNMVKHCDFLFCNTRHSQEYLRAAYPGVKAVLTGFPFGEELPERELGGSEILIPGRLDFDRVPTILMEALAPLGAKVTFLTPQTEEESPFARWMKDAYLKAYPSITIEFGVTPEIWHKRCAKAHSVLIGSQFDTLNLSCVTAVLMGVPVAAPRRPPFTEYLDAHCLYTPYDLDSIRRAVMLPVPCTTLRARTLTTPKVVAGTYIQTMLPLE